MIKRLFCKIGWHSWPSGFHTITAHPISGKVQCKWCDAVGMRDSQGNFFESSEPPKRYVFSYHQNLYGWYCEAIEEGKPGFFVFCDGPKRSRIEARLSVIRTIREFEEPTPDETITL